MLEACWIFDKLVGVYAFGAYLEFDVFDFDDSIFEAFQVFSIVETFEAQIEWSIHGFEELE